MSAAHDIRDEALADEGQRRITWAKDHMPVLAQIRARFERERPLAGVKVSACLHVTTETANLLRTLAAGGATVRVCASNPLSTQDDVAASLVVHDGISVFAIRGEDKRSYYAHVQAAASHGPRVTLDDGADLVTYVHTDGRTLLAGIVGGTEETTTGVQRLRAMAADGALAYPLIAVNDADTKHLFDNRYGTGQSALDGVLRATNLLFAGARVVVAGYGWCGRGIANKARGLGARVIVTEVAPLRALEAVMDGFEVMPMLEAAALGEIFLTATGDARVIDLPHFARMRDGAVLANAGHFDVEVNVAALRALAVEVRHPRAHVEEIVLADGRRLCLLAEGRLVNLAAAEGHPASVMDMSFANQALVVEHLVKHGAELAAAVHPVPRSIDEQVARLKLAALGAHIDTLTPEQARYVTSWKEGT